jgi:hypothetical protein
MAADNTPKNILQQFTQVPGSKWQVSTIASLFLPVLWVIVNSVAYAQSGIFISLEATKYIENADNLIAHGKLISPQFIFYFSQIAIILVSKITGTFPFLPFIIQLALNALATLCFFRIIKACTSNLLVSAGATAYLLGMYYYQQYNTYLYTESLFFSLSILYFYFLIKTSPNRLSTFVWPVLLLFVLYFTRPVGLFYIPATFIYLVLRFFPNKGKTILSITGLIFLLLFILLLNSSLNIGGEFNFLLPFEQEQIICGIATIREAHHFDVPVEPNSVQGLLYLISSNSTLFISLAFKRFIAFWGVTRPYYSSIHNIYISFYFYTLYILGIASFFKLKHKNLHEISFMLCIIMLTMATTLLSCDEWHNRFIFGIFPFLVILATFAFTKAENLNSNAR